MGLGTIRSIVKLIIAGSRDIILKPEEIHYLLSKVGIDTSSISQVVSGRCKGMDVSGENFGSVYISDKPNWLKTIPADWTAHGRSAGPKRNREMALYADALFLVWNGESSGSGSMKREMLNASKPIFEVIFRASKGSV